MSCNSIAPTVESEVRHFDTLVDATGESWWGHRTLAGAFRLRRRAEMIQATLPLGPNCRVLEIAAGAGALTEAVLTICPQARIVATDISPVSVEHLTQRVGRFSNVEPAVKDITATGFEDGEFDAVMGNSALHHVDVPACVTELYRVMRPGARLAVFEPNLLNPEILIETTAARRIANRGLDYSATERTHTRWTYAGHLRRAGFVEVRVTPFDFLHPATPGALIPFVRPVAWLVEYVPGCREFSGSLFLTARRP